MRSNHLRSDSRAYSCAYSCADSGADSGTDSGSAPTFFSAPGFIFIPDLSSLPHIPRPSPVDTAAGLGMQRCRIRVRGGQWHAPVPPGTLLLRVRCQTGVRPGSDRRQTRVRPVPDSCNPRQMRGKVRGRHLLLRRDIL